MPISRRTEGKRGPGAARKYSERPVGAVCFLMNRCRKRDLSAVAMTIAKNVNSPEIQGLSVRDIFGT